MTGIKSHIDLPTSEVFILENDILVVRYKDDVTIEVEDAKRHVEAFMEMNDGKEDRMVLIDGRVNSSQIDPDAKRFLAKSPHNNCIGKMAIIVESLGARLIASFYIKLNKAAFPKKVFKSKKEAITWLLSDQ